MTDHRPHPDADDTTARPDEFDPRIEQWLDGALSPQEASALEARANDDKALRVERDMQRSVNESLARQWHPPATPALSGVVATARDEFALSGGDDRAGQDADAAVRSSTAAGSPPTGPAPTPAWINRLAVAATLAIVVGASWMIWRTIVPSKHRPHEIVPASMESVYASCVETGFAPYWVCEDDAEFIETFQKRLAQGLRLEPLPADMNALGLIYCNTLSPMTTGVLVRAGDAQVIVFVDRVDSESGPNVPTDPELNQFRTTVGALVLYERTPLDEPRVLPFFTQP